MPDPDFERIEPAALDLAPVTPAAAPAARGPQAQAHPPSKSAFVVLGALLLVAAGVFFLLPDLLSRPQSPTAVAQGGGSAAPPAPETAPAARPGAPSTTPAAAQSPWQQAQADRERAAAKDALDALLALQYELQERKVEAWAKTEFDAAIALAQEGDAAYRESRFTDATARYRAGETSLRALRDGIPARLEAVLTAGDAAFAAGDQAAAIAAFGEAVAIDPANTRASEGLTRAKNLDRLGALLASGSARESSGQFEQAAQTYREALALDMQWEPARAALAAVEARITGEKSAARLSAAYAALAAGQLENARREFRAAESLGGGAAAREGLQQVEFQTAQQRIGALLDSASGAERAEDWKRALAQYEAALAIDPALGAASTGRERARTRLALDEALTRMVADPGKLANDTARRAADTLIASANAIPDPGPRLSGQISAAQRTLSAMRTEMPVQLRSDGKTDVIVFRVGSLGSFVEKSLSLLPGSYVAVGRRDGFRDVRVEFSLRPGAIDDPGRRAVRAKDLMDGKPDITGQDAPIAPLPYSPPDPAVKAPAPRRPDRQQITVGGVLLAVGLFVWFLLSAASLRIETDPPGADVAIDGGLHLVLGRSVLLRPGDYGVRATAEGYRPIERTLRIADGSNTLALTLEKLPGRISVLTRPAPARVLLDGEHIGQSNGEALEIAAGLHRLRVEAERFLPQEQELQVEGLGKEQSLSLTLAPAWGNYRLETDPAGATVLLEGTAIGNTPATLELLQGPRQLQVSLAGYRDETLFVDAKAGEQKTLDRMALVRADAQLRITSSPGGASITLDGQFRGTTPLELSLESGKPHELIAFKAGHERTLRRFTTAAGSQEMNIALRALAGEIRITVSPRDAAIFAGTRQLASGTATLSLPAAEQVLTVRRGGYADETLRVMPRPGFPQAFSVSLKTLAQKEESAARTQVKTSAGQELALLRPGSFRMGSSRRESGRRANEAMREIRLTRPYYLSVTEVTNAEFRQFRPAHSSGNFKGKSLNGDTQPATNLGWTDAALYCNWLSERENLKPFYRVSGKAVTGIEPGATGYRLPTEAEWAWAATLTTDGNLLRFPWGAELPPATKAGNYADKSGENILGAIITGYDDGFPVSAPVRSFAPNRLGLFDIGGNAAEWVHDIYDAAPPGSGVQTDPLGADIGEYHVIRGASWRNGGLTELRLAFRDYGAEARADVGFRIARYLK